MKIFRTWQAVVGTVALGMAANASAVPVTFDLADGPDSSVSITSLNKWCLTTCGVTASLNPSIDLLSATLSAGQSWTFDFFTLNFYGSGMASGTLAASLGFDAPAGAPIADGNGSGTFLTSFLLTEGSLNWTSQPGAFSLADGTNYSVFFENVSGFTWGQNVDVRARLTLNSEPTLQVPEPNSTALMGIGLLALGLMLGARRRRQHNSTSF